MAFVEQGSKQPVLSYFLPELDLSNKSFVTSPSTLEKHKDANKQGSFATRALDHLSKISDANNSILQLASSSAIPHWMGSNHVQNFPVNMSIKSGSTRTMVASTSMPSETLLALSALPSSKLGFGAEGKTNSSIVIESMDGLVNSRHLSQQHTSGRPPLSVRSVPSHSHRRNGQKEEPKVSKEDVLAFSLQKQEKQPALVDLPILSLGVSSGQRSHERAEVSSWVSKFPFQIASSSGQAEHGQFTQCRENIGHNLLTKSKDKYLTEGACREVSNVASQFMGSKGQIDHSKLLLERSRSLTEVVSPQKTSLANTSLDSALPLPATISWSNAPSLKRDWSATLIQDVRHSQLLPEFFAQQKVMVAAKANPSSFVKSEGTEKIGKFICSQKTTASRVSEENAGFNLASLHRTIHSDKSRNTLTDHKSIEQQEMKNEEEALKTTTWSSQQSLHDSLRHVDLLKVKLETLTGDSKAFKGVKFASMKSVERYDRFASSEGRVLIEAVPLSCTAGDQAASGKEGMVATSRPAELMLFRDRASAEPSPIVSVGVPSLSLPKHSLDFDGLEEGKFSANKHALRDGDWGDFLAAPSIGQIAGTDGKPMLPFQQRFEQLQKFLKKCDGSGDEYCLRALCSLSKTAKSNQSAELESRALRLSVEEGKEMKRAKLLNVLDEIPEGACMDPHANLMAPWFSTSRAVAVAKEEA